ncbi:uncharacterized protein LOC101845154 [Aplysia californica]|uniref:Uncharacterized protein LOC101845154 n=1 Tax=Aplysia californica TaxID=6500 RepID=A0ABM1VPJ1_APLCA|nr:uncharacterized protein LOC101845154 [Aplysia californica]
MSEAVHKNSCRWYADYQNPVAGSSPDELRVLDIRHSAWILSDSNPLTSVAGADQLNLTSDYDCGHDRSLEVFINRNVTDIIEPSNVSLHDLGLSLDDVQKQLNSDLEEDLDLTFMFGGTTGPVKPEDRLNRDREKVVSDENTFKRIGPKNGNQSKEGGPAGQQDLSALSAARDESSVEAETDFLDVLNKAFKTRTRCHYKRLIVLDESQNRLTPLFHFEFLVQEADYPVLEVMNFSNIMLRAVPRELSQWRRHFAALTLLDLSHNLISELEVANYPPRPGAKLVTFDLRHNNITTLSKDVLQKWAEVEGFHVDIRDNPIHCGCELSSFLSYLHNPTAFAGRLAQYEYVKHLRCASPMNLAGNPLHKLSVDMLSCPEMESNAEALIALGVILVLLILGIIFVLKFKVEIRILLYTRLHIRLPCDSDDARHSKTYDAFVSYSNEDDTWVFENLVKYLENRDNIFSVNDFQLKGHGHRDVNHTDPNRKTFKLCIHQVRDFIPGKTIFDNIVESIEASRHTIIVLSPSFMRSHWAMEELRQAYKQSLVEKTRHLIVLLLEKVPKEQMDPLISRCCKTFTYLDVHDSFFKDRLVFSLSTKDRAARRRERLEAEKSGRDRLSSPSSLSTLGPESSSSHYYDINSAYLNSGYINNTEGPSAYSPLPVRPSETLRELSNMSTSSTTALTDG